MGIFNSISTTIQAVLSPVNETAEAIGKTVQMGTKTVDRYATKQSMTQSKRIAMDTAKELRIIQEELESDEGLNAIFAQIEKEFA